jgi:hypothetical protein
MDVGRVTQTAGPSLAPISRQTLPDGTPAWAAPPSRRDRFVTGLKDGAMTGTLLTLVGAVPAAGIALVGGGGARLAGRALAREGLQAAGTRFMVRGLRGSALAAGGLIVGGTILGGAVAYSTTDPARGLKAGAVGGAILAASPFAGLGQWRAAVIAGAVGAAAGAVIGGASAL